MPEVTHNPNGIEEDGDKAYNQYVNSTEIPDDQIIDSIFSERKTSHAEDAIDYEDIDELADEEDAIEDLPMDESINGSNSNDNNKDNDEFNRMLQEGQPELTNEEEMAAQAAAESQFDALFGNSNDFDSNIGHHDDMGGDSNENHHSSVNDHDGLFNNLGNGNHLLEDDDGLNDLGDLFYDHEEDSSVANTKKHKLDDDGNNNGKSAQENQQQKENKRQLKRQKLQKIVKQLEKEQMKRNIKYYFPTYSRHKPFNFHKFFSPNPQYYRYQRPAIAFSKNIKPLIPTKVNLEIEVDQKKIFKLRSADSATLSHEAKNVTNITQADLDFIKNLEIKRSSIDSFIKEIDYVKRDWTSSDKFDHYSKDLVLATTDWDDDAIINAGEDEYSIVKPINELLLDNPLDDCKLTGAKIDNDNSNNNYNQNNGNVLEEGEDDDIFNGQINLNELKLDMNDPNLLFVPSRKVDATKSVVPSTDKLLELKFNISNDQEYELLRKNYNTKQRSQLSNLNIEHSVPALRLQAPYYKVKLSTDETRSFHRPVFNVRPGTLVSFCKLKLRKRKKDKGKSLQQIFSKTGDLTVADTGNIIALEYSEQYPPILSNFGMGSKLINYYRKERPNDTSRPKAQIGETHILGVEDRSPFWNFGEVAPGDFVPTLYNNMVRAPIFKHDNKPTDFLLVKSQGAGSHQKFYLRGINFNFAVGNTFPVEVPAPHSRKVTNISKNRLKMVVFRVMNSIGMPRISVKDVSKHFPEHTDMQNRQRLKEFMEYQRQGDDQGYWKVRGLNDVIPGEEEIRAMITPEDSSLMDTMQYGQQVLDDNMMLFGEQSRQESSRNRKGDKREDSIVDETENGDDMNKDKEKEIEKEKEREEEKGKDKDKEKDKSEKEKAKKSKEQDTEIDVEEELAPWNLSRNFVIANQTKTMLQLNGEGDPTGIGLGFSMLRATQKNPFKPLFTPPPENVPKSNAAAHNQKLYEQEIKRIWYSQRSSLVDHGEGSDLKLQQIYNEYPPADHESYLKSKLEQIQQGQQTDSQLLSDQQQQNQVLRITRRVRDENGIVHRKVEFIHDPRLIRAYVKRKKQIEDELLKNADVDEILPTNDKELNKIRRKALEEKLANLEKRAKQSRAKKPPKDLIHAAAAAGATIIDANTVMLPDGSYVIGGKGIGKGKSRTRRCKNCGAYGHIRTNAKCPLYKKMVLGIDDGSAVPVDSTPAAGAGDGIGEITTSTAVALDTQRIEEQNLGEV